MSVSRYLAITLLAGLALPVVAANVTQVSRYATVANEPLPAQVSPLKAVQQIHFPQAVQTIGEAVHYWLHHSGFYLVDDSKQSQVLQQVLNQPLPQIDRNLGPLEIEQGLLVLVGKNEFLLETVSFSREINFQLKGVPA